jgi:hypothetical protein
MLTQKLGLLYDIGKTANSGVSVRLGFTLLVQFHSDVLAHAAFPLNVWALRNSCISLCCLTCDYIVSANEALSRPRD